MKPLAVLHTEASCGWGGQEIRILTEMQALAERGHRVQLLAPEHATIYREARRRQLSVEAMPIEFRRLEGYRALSQWLRREGRRFDVINTHSSADSWLAALVRLTQRDLPPIVRTRHVSTRVNRSRTTRWLYERATARIVVTGDALKRQLVRDNGFDARRITSVRTGIDLNRFAPRDRESMRARLGLDRRPAMAIVATLRDWKGHDDLLDVWPTLQSRRPGWQLLVVGDGPRRAHLEARIAKEGLQQWVHLVGHREAPEDWFACADIVALPSWGEEGVPQSLMQAAACARPVISTTIGAIDEAVRDGETGYLVPPRDREALQQAILRLMLDPALRKRMGTAARTLAEREFGIDEMAERMIALFRDVAAARN